jgi:hypothetical protein
MLQVQPAQVSSSTLYCTLGSLLLCTLTVPSLPADTLVGCTSLAFTMAWVVYSSCFWLGS